MSNELPRWVTYLDNGWRYGVWTRTVENGRREGMYELVIPVVGGGRKKILVQLDDVKTDHVVKTDMCPKKFIEGI